MQSLNESQLHLERSIGQLKAAARCMERRGDEARSVRLMQLALEVCTLRDPAAVEFLDGKRLRRLQRSARANV